MGDLLTEAEEATPPEEEALFNISHNQHPLESVLFAKSVVALVIQL